jgi:hypothetical protein
MIVSGETEAALRERNPAKGQSSGLIETMNGAQRHHFCAPQKTTSDR